MKSEPKYPEIPFSKENVRDMYRGSSYEPSFLNLTSEWLLVSINISCSPTSTENIMINADINVRGLKK